jgi:hypothetical protein
MIRFLSVACFAALTTLLPLRTEALAASAESSFSWDDATPTVTPTTVSQTVSTQVDVNDTVSMFGTSFLRQAVLLIEVPKTQFVRVESSSSFDMRLVGPISETTTNNRSLATDLRPGTYALIAQTPAVAGGRDLGVKLSDTHEGVYVGKVQPGTLAYDFGLKKGMFIDEINGVAMKNVQHINDTVPALPNKGTFTIRMPMINLTKKLEYVAPKRSGGEQAISIQVVAGAAKTAAIAKSGLTSDDSHLCRWMPEILVKEYEGGGQYGEPRHSRDFRYVMSLRKASGVLAQYGREMDLPMIFECGEMASIQSDSGLLKVLHAKKANPQDWKAAHYLQQESWELKKDKYGTPIRKELVVMTYVQNVPALRKWALWQTEE